MSIKNKNNKNDRIIYALQDYLEGLTLGEIAKKYEISFRTIQSWHRRYEWAKKREQALAEAHSTIYRKFQDKIADSSERFLETARIGSQLTFWRMSDLYQKIMSKRGDARGEAFEKLFLELRKIALFGNDLTRMQKSCMPNASEELSRLIYDELKRIGNAGLMMNSSTNGTSQIGANSANDENSDK